MTTESRDEREEAPERIWIDAAPHLIADATRHIYVEPPPPHFRDFNSVEYVRADLAATRMRNACLQRVRDLEAAWLGDSRTEANDDRSNAAYEKCCAARVIAKELESLTLDQVEKKQ